MYVMNFWWLMSGAVNAADLWGSLDTLLKRQMGRRQPGV